MNLKFSVFVLILTQSQNNVENIDVHRLAKGYVQWISLLKILKKVWYDMITTTPTYKSNSRNT